MCATDPLGLWSIDEGLDWVAGGLLHGPGANVTSFIVGFGDGASFGLISAIRKSRLPGSECTFAKDGFYFAGEVTGTVASSFTFAGALTKAIGFVARVGETLSSFANIAKEAAHLEEVSGEAGEFACWHRTTAVLQTTEGVNIVASGVRDLAPAQRAVVEAAGNTVAMLRGKHAEVTALEAAYCTGLNPFAYNHESQHLP